MEWLRAKLTWFPLIFLALALVALAVDWALSASTTQETLVTAILGAGALVLFALKWSLVRRPRRGTSDD